MHIKKVNCSCFLEHIAWKCCLNMDENIAILSFVAFIRLVLSCRAEHVGFMWSRWNITGYVPIWNSKRKIFPFILKEKKKPSLFSISVLSLKPLYQVLPLKGQKHKRLQKPCSREPEEVWREVCFIWWRRTFMLSDHFPGRHYWEPISFVLGFPAETSSKGLGSRSQRPSCQP